MMKIQHNKAVVTITLLVQLCLYPDAFAAPPPGNEHAKAQAAFERGQYRQAVVHYQRLLRDDPDNAAYRTQLAESYELNNHLDLAEQHASQALASDRKNVEALLVMGRLRARQENWQVAKDYFERAVKADNKNPLAWAGLSQSSIELGDLGGAEAASAEYLKLTQGSKR